MLQKLLECGPCIFILSCCDLGRGYFSPYFVLGVRRIARNDLLEVLNCVRVPLLRASDTTELVARVDFIRINLDSFFKSLASCIKLPARLMEQSKIVMGRRIRRIQSGQFHVLLES